MIFIHKIFTSLTNPSFHIATVYFAVADVIKKTFYWSSTFFSDKV